MPDSTVEQRPYYFDIISEHFWIGLFCHGNEKRPAAVDDWNRRGETRKMPKIIRRFIGQETLRRAIFSWPHYFFTNTKFRPMGRDQGTPQLTLDLPIYRMYLTWRYCISLLRRTALASLKLVHGLLRCYYREVVWLEEYSLESDSKLQVDRFLWRIKFTFFSTRMVGFAEPLHRFGISVVDWG